MKCILIIIVSMFSLHTYAQVSEELLVYSVKGNVTVIEDNKESKLKIGKVLKPKSVIKTDKDSKLTLVCKKGKAISVVQEGIYPVDNWKDSCREPHVSVTTNYFQFIWAQLYLRSPEGMEEVKNGSMSISNDGAVLRSGEEITDIKIEFNIALDTVNYTEGDFPLTWSSPGFDGKFLFQLFNSAGKLVYKDSISDNLVKISKFSRLLQPGKSYRWLIGTKGISIRKPRVINGVKPIMLKEFIESIDSLDVPEDPAAVYFRIGYMLEKKRYYAHVYDYYHKAVEIEPENDLYRQRLLDFSRNFRVPIRPGLKNMD